MSNLTSNDVQQAELLVSVAGYLFITTCVFGLTMFAAAVFWKLCAIVVRMSDEPKDYIHPGGPRT